MRGIFGRGRYADVTATVALIVALGGTAYAANTVRSRDIVDGQVKRADLARGAVSSSKVQDGGLLRQDFRTGQLPRGPRGFAGPAGPVGPRGVQGLQGATGAAGSASAFARVSDAGAVDAARSRNVVQANVSRPAVGVYCFAGMVPAPVNAVATAQFFNASVNLFMGFYAGCPEATQVSVVTWTDGAGAADVADDTPFTILFN
jgi:hypothetical protein